MNYEMELAETITFKDRQIKAVINKTNSDGAAGCDGITQPHIKHLGDNGVYLSSTTFNVWSKVKNPSPSDLFSCITSLPILCKVFERLIPWRLSDVSVKQNVYILQGFGKER